MSAIDPAMLMAVAAMISSLSNLVWALRRRAGGGGLARCDRPN